MEQKKNPVNTESCAKMTENTNAEKAVSAGACFEEFRQIVAALRAENGCPWDRAQTMESLKVCMINEMTEALAAIDLYQISSDAENLCEELGDVLLQVVLLAQIAAEKDLFTIEDVVSGISQKMIRRHPHVFATDSDRPGQEEVPGRWEEIKRLEKQNRTPDQKRMEQEAFRRAAQDVMHHLEKI